MSAWRRAALEQFPERAAHIRAEPSVYGLLSSLEADLRAVYAGRRREPDLPNRVFAYAAWCFGPEQDWPLRNAVAVGFYEHVPKVESGRRDLAERLTFATLQELHPLFASMLRPADYDALQTEIARVDGRPLPIAVPPHLTWRCAAQAITTATPCRGTSPSSGA